MQLEEFQITKLFGKYDHTISFPHRAENDPNPSLVVLYGKNGIGKTTILKMIDGIIKLDFNIYRALPFKQSHLQFSNGAKIKVEFTKGPNKKEDSLLVTYKGKKIYLNYHHSGPLDEKDMQTVDNFRERFYSETSAINYELINTERLSQQNEEDDRQYNAPHELTPADVAYMKDRAAIYGRLPSRVCKKPLRVRPGKLAIRVREFLSEAQVNYRNYFATTEPDLFPKILERITGETEKEYKANELIKRINSLSKREKIFEHFGLEPESWNKNKLTSILRDSSGKTSADHALMIADSYLDYLEGKVAQRELITNRLSTFEEIIKTFITDKHISINSKEGLIIKIQKNASLRESQLSSGEYHLLFLLVSALVTKRSGTVIAIDEPEMSMHISWQRKLVDAILKCASMAQPQLVLATHSPDIAAEFPENLINLVEQND